MGGWLSRFRRQQTTEEILESIDKDITKLQRFRRKNQEQQQKVVLRLVVGSILLSITTFLVVFLLYFPDTWRDRILYICLPSISYVFFILGLRKLLHWYFVKRIANNDFALAEIRERRKQILEDVMENETYKKAKQILERFDPARFKQLEKPVTTPSPPQLQKSTPNTVLRQRHVPGMQRTPAPTLRSPVIWQTPSAGTPCPPGQGGLFTPRRATPNQNGSFVQGYGPPPGPPLPRPILPRERSTMDKMMEFLVGDGPSNRYALICRYCHSHNGMALKEEFEYLTFRCCYCFTVNPARKQRPFAPKLEFPAPPSQQSTPPPQRALPPGAGPRMQTAEDESDGDEEDDYDEDDDEDEEGSDEEAELEEGGEAKGVMEQKGAEAGATSKEGDEKKAPGQSTAAPKAVSTRLPVRKLAPTSTAAMPRPEAPGSAAMPRLQTGVRDLGHKQELPRQPETIVAPAKTVPVQTKELVQPASAPAVVQSGKVVMLRKSTESRVESSVDSPVDQKNDPVAAIGSKSEKKDS